MPHVQDVNLVTQNGKQETISTTVPSSEEQLPNGFLKRRALWCQRATLRMVGKILCAMSCSAYPVPGRDWGLATDVAIDCPEICLGLGRDDDAVGHLPGRASPSSSANTSSACRPIPFLA